MSRQKNDYCNALVERRRYVVDRRWHVWPFSVVMFIEGCFLLMSPFSSRRAIIMTVSALCLIITIMLSFSWEDKISRWYPGMGSLLFAQPRTIKEMQIATMSVRTRRSDDQEIVENDAIRYVAELVEEVDAFNSGLVRWGRVVEQDQKRAMTNIEAVLMIQDELLQAKTRLEIRMARAEALFQVRDGVSVIPTHLRIEQYREPTVDMTGGQEAVDDALASVEAAAVLSGSLELLSEK